MSAFLCSDTHTAALALSYARQFAQPVRTQYVVQVARILRELNNHALQCRYNDTPQQLPDDMLPVLARATAWLESATDADVHGLARCFNYQCAEGDTPTLPNWSYIDQLVSAFETLADGSKSEVWSIEDDTPPPAPIQPTPGPEQWQAKKAARAAVSAALVAANPHLVPISGKVDSLQAAAKNARIELRAAFPGVKFSVKTSRYSGGDSMSVSWTDGPTSDQVSPIVDRYAAGSFNGMDDSYTYSDSAWRDAFGDAKYVSCNRHDSDRAVESAIRTVRAKYSANFESLGIDTPTVEQFRAGALWNVNVIIGSVSFHHDGLQSLINRELYRRTWALPRRAVNRESVEA